MFKIENRPVVIPPRFRPLFEAIVFRDHDRVNVIAPTQDGKSVTIAVAVLLVASTTSERFVIVAPNEKKADIIMSYIREFAVDNPIIASQLELDKTDTLERLKRERSKKHLTFKRGGGVFTLTLDARNTKRNIQAAMGFGAKNIIADEAGLVDDILWATVMRMLGGDFKDEKRRKIIVKIGNPFYDNHFKRTSESPRYLQIFHNYKDSIRDYEAGFYGYSPDFIEEMRQEALFDVLYECKFPEGDTIDAKGYRRLITSELLKYRKLPFTDEQRKTTIVPLGQPRLGIDVGGGGDYNTFIVRWDNYAKIARYNISDDTMVNVTESEEVVKEYGIKWENVNIDDIGVGRGVRDRLIEKGYPVNGVSVGDSSSEPDKYANLKAELSWKTMLWLKGEVFLEPIQIGSLNPWVQCTWQKYKVNTDKCIKMMPKDELKAENNGKSPDFWEGLMLTFDEPKPFGIM